MNDVKQLEDKKLDKVNGGTLVQAREDYKEFVELGLFLDYSNFSVSNVRDMFKSFGIRYEDHGGTIYNNRYYFSDIEITREEAFAIIKKDLENK